MSGSGNIIIFGYSNVNFSGSFQGKSRSKMRNNISSGLKVMNV